MPNLPPKKKRPWIPIKERKIDHLNKHKSRSSGDMKHFYNSKAWRSLRNYKIQINPLCEICERKGLLEPGKEIDHIVAIKDDGPRLSLNNLQTLCKSCHASKSSVEGKVRYYKKNIKKSFEF